ncbi:MAG: metalloprotease [Rickettsiales bacterium]|nr:metalloprotease [Rickettsiales bacterium]
MILRSLQIVCIFSAISLTLSGCVTDGLNPAALTGLATDAYGAMSYSDKDAANDAKNFMVELDNKAQIAPVNNKYDERLQRLFAKHRNEDGLNLNFKVYVSNTANAFAAANGDIRVYSGLMDMMSDDELLFVIGHEIGHVAKGHSKQAQKLAKGTSAAFKGMELSEYTKPVASSDWAKLGAQVVNQQFSQHDETESDEYALKFMKKHGYDAKACVTALNKLAAQGGAKTGFLDKFLSSHPDPKKRAENLQKRI